MSSTFNPFDPLEAKQAINTEVAINALKREIRNILNSYVGWFDPLSELIQNSLDSIEERILMAGDDYQPKIKITINLTDNLIIVSDNGLGLNEDKFRQFLAPNFSFKDQDGSTRGHKGVGATYLAYGFNYIQVCTKSDEFSANGKMIGAKSWLTNPNPEGNPKMIFDKDGSQDPFFDECDFGVSICVKFDQNTYPKKINWIGANTAEKWHQILSIKTGLGAIKENELINFEIDVIGYSNSNYSNKGISYLKAENIAQKSARFSDILNKEEELFKRRGANFNLPNKYKNLDLFYDSLTTDDLKRLLNLDSDEVEFCYKFSPQVYFAYAYSAKFWNAYNEKLGIRANYKVISGGIQLAANNMPQGEIISIPLARGTNRQNQIHLVFHFSNCSADLGRKGFQKQIVDFAQEISRKLIEGPLQKTKNRLRPITGIIPDLIRQKAINDWKEEMKTYEKSHSLEISNEQFFLPTKKISILSNPSREQDVIALFNQLLAGGVIRGIRIMATNERSTYDGLFRISFDEEEEHLLFHESDNPLGVLLEILEGHIGFISEPKVLEYKFSLDGLIENLEDGSKNSNDIDLVVVWETGKDFLGNYTITSLLDTDNLNLRQYHGATHLMTNVSNGQKEMDLIVLSELLSYLNHPNEEAQHQTKKYEYGEMD